MKLPLPFRRDVPSVLKRADAQDQAERLLAESLRMLGQVCAKVADYVEAQRLARQGYAQGPTVTLKRLDRDEGPHQG